LPSTLCRFAAVDRTRSAFLSTDIDLLLDLRDWRRVQSMLDGRKLAPDVGIGEVLCDTLLNLAVRQPTR